MSDTSDVHPGANIVPSARKGIHSHCDTCCLRCINMGKYGLPKKHVERSGGTSQGGLDEIDNVMSKMSRQTSPIPTRSNNALYRRNSFDDHNTDDSDEEDAENVLSKSSPPSFSNYSEELYTSAIQNELQRSRNASQSSINTYSTPQYKSVNTNNHNRSQSKLRYENVQGNSKNNMLLIILGIIVLLLGVMARSLLTSKPVEIDTVYNKLRFYNDVKGLKEKYKVEENSILQVRTGIATIFENQDTASFIFAYNSKDNSFNPIKFNNFIEDVVTTASRYLRNDSHEIQTTTVDTSNLIMRTEKEFMNRYRDDVTRTGVMLVRDIDTIPAELAMAFHYYCDEYNPLVKQSAIFFTLNLAKCSNSTGKKSIHEYIEKCLAKKWNTVDEEKIGPLLTRVVNIVVDVTQTF